MATLVLGSSGFVGTPFSRYLEKCGEQVIRFDIAKDSSEDARVACFDLENVDSVYFLAWEVGGSKYLYRKDTQLLQLDWNLQLLSNVMPQLYKKMFLFCLYRVNFQRNTILFMV